MKHNKNLLHLAFLLLVALPYQSWAQGRSIPKGSEARAKEEATKVLDDILPAGQKYRYPLLDGLNISVDIFDPIMRIAAFDHCSYEAQTMLSLHNRYLPMASFGFGEARDKSNNGNDFGTDQKQEFLFESKKGLFGKVGMAYNLNYNDKNKADTYLVMMRYGVAWNKADITNLYYADDVWGALGPISLTDQEYTTHWIELGGMIKVQVWQHISMGWDLYWKIKLAQTGTKLGEPYYVPGLGANDSSLGFSFRVFYDIF